METMIFIVKTRIYTEIPSFVPSNCSKTMAVKISAPFENIPSPATSVCPASINYHQLHNCSNENLQYLGLRKTECGARGPYASYITLGDRSAKSTGSHCLQNQKGKQLIKTLSGSLHEV